jgi:tRNA(adenine34) deaminase
VSIEPLYTPEFFMKEALKEAKKAFDEDEVPIGVVIVAGNKIIARGHNLTEKLRDVTAHAEMQAITSAASAIGGKFLNECDIYVTLEPCVMCAGAIKWSRVKRLIYGASDAKFGYTKSGENILHPKTEVTKGILSQESEELLKEFFSKKRD